MHTNAGGVLHYTGPGAGRRQRGDMSGPTRLAIIVLAMTIAHGITIAGQEVDTAFERVTAFRCDNGDVLVIESVEEGGPYLHQSLKRIRLTPTASGWRGADLAIRRDADSLVVRRDEGTTRCVEDARETRRQAARLSGMAVIASGAQPHWRLSFNGAHAILETAEERRTFHGEDSGVDPASGSTAYRFHDDAGVLRVQLIEEPCQLPDAPPLPLRVRASVGGTVLEGCGEALH